MIILLILLLFIIFIIFIIFILGWYIVNSDKAIQDELKKGKK